MDINTLYYTLSTIPQVLAATTAVLAAFLHFRLRDIQDFLVGDGLSTYQRLDNIGFEFREMYKNRLRDGINRKSIYEIGEVLEILSNEEAKNGYTKIKRPTGLQYVFEDRFTKTETYFRNIKMYSVVVISFSIFSIILSLICLKSVDSIVNKGWSEFILNLNVIVFVLALCSSLGIVIGTFSHKTTYENLKARDEIIKKNRETE
ncbi:hypothetical protein ACFLS4_05490 [Bacteroidota bacterium]